VWDILPGVHWSIIVSFKSPWLQQQAFGHARRRRSLQIEQIWQWQKQIVIISITLLVEFENF
jgi:hypothetical protein